MLTLVVDTNIVVSALLKPQGNPALIISLVLRKKCRLCLSKEIFTEYEEVLSRDKFRNLDQTKVKELISLLKKNALWVRPTVSIDGIARDQADRAFLACALETKADFLITGNIQHFPIKKFHHTLIVTPSEFLELVTRSMA